MSLSKPGTTADTPAPKPARKGRRRLLMLSLPLVLALGGGGVWLTGGRYVTTENAYVHQPMVTVSSDVAGRIAQVNVRENQMIEAGTPIFGIDPEPYQIALARADAALAQARLAVGQLRAAYETAQAQLEAAARILTIKERELERQKSLADKGLNATAALDEALISERSAMNAADIARRQLAAAAAALGGDPSVAVDEMPSVRAALAARDAAARDLAKTQTIAPVAGFVAQVDSLNVGQFVGAGTSVATLVQSTPTWIEANFKETQLDTLQIGQAVTISVDAYPGLELRGTVESFGSATGSQFSLIPAQNATGNWVKVVQRLSVRIRIDDTLDRPLRDGMSAHVSVDTGRSHLDNLL